MHQAHQVHQVHTKILLLVMLVLVLSQALIASTEPNVRFTSKGIIHSPKCQKAFDNMLKYTSEANAYSKDKDKGIDLTFRGLLLQSKKAMHTMATECYVGTNMNELITMIEENSETLGIVDITLTKRGEL